jgi:hypothetical protein
MDQAVKDHFYSAIERAPTVDEPFTHLYAAEIFPASFYAKLLDNLPPREGYKQFPAPYEERFGIELAPSTARTINDFWIDFEDWLHSAELLSFMARKFGPALQECYGHRRSFVEQSSKDNEVEITMRSLLVRDFKNFSILPHTDGNTKFITGAFYFPKDESQIEFGTSIYRPKDPGFRDFQTTRYPREQFELAKTAENKPNSFFAFVKSDRSFHGVEDHEHSNSGRDVMFWLPQIGRGANAERVNTLPIGTFKPAAA